jgi:3-hydroxypropanoate dehydrogenase
MAAPLDATALGVLFEAARTHAAWLDRPVSDDTLRGLDALPRHGPTAASCSPGRFVFVGTQAVKERLKPAPPRGNLDKTVRAGHRDRRL